MNGTPLYNLDPVAEMALLGLVLALGPLAWLWLRHRDGGVSAWLKALSWVTLFLTFDLVLFGAFTRLTDSGLGCPDWPGCYGNASPLGAHAEISLAQSALPSGPVTHGKAWIEMIHRYLAVAVGLLITVLMLASWWLRRRIATVSPLAATATFLWVCLQGAFGALTVTLKLYPAIVTAHLLGGMVLLALLTWQATAHDDATPPLRITPGLRRGAAWVLALSALQIALGGWVSTNYAVLACGDFPTCQGSWWPSMDLDHGFTLLRGLGLGKDGGYLPFAALTAIHFVHRLGALVLFCALSWLAWRLARQAHEEPRLRMFSAGVLAVALWQFATGLSNVVLGWPLISAVAHTGGAAALVVLLTRLQAQARTARSRLHSPAAAPSALLREPT